MLGEGKVLAVPDSSVIDTGSQQIVYRQSSPDVYEGVEVALGPKMSNAEGVTFYPVLHGVEQGDLIVTSGSFLVDAETRLNPAAGSIYFGNSVGSNTTSSTNSDVRPSTPEDPQAKITASLAKLSDEDRALVQTQKFCPILNTVLGSMGPPVKVVIDGQPVFLCCNGCKQKALANPEQTLAKVAELKTKTKAEASSSGSITGPAPATMEKPNTVTDSGKDSDNEIASELAKLSSDDRKLVETQRSCPITGNRLGSMGPPVKVMIDGQPVFLCCDGCKDEAFKDTIATLAKVADLKRTNATSK
jgi:hypothetical protein